MSNEFSHLDIAIAKTLAVKFHAGQNYGNFPYTTHLEDVATSVKAGMTDHRMLVVAYLHDILEDTTCSVDLLFALFEDHIVHSVVAITRTKGEAKEDYLRKVKANHMARIVKIHDSLCNLRASVIRFDAKRIKKYTEQIAFLASETAT